MPTGYQKTNLAVEKKNEVDFIALLPIGKPENLLPCRLQLITVGIA